MDKDKTGLALTVSVAFVMAIIAAGILPRYSETITAKVNYFLNGSSKDNPFCLSFVGCPERQDTLLVSAPEATISPGPTSKIQGVTKPAKAKVSPTETPEPEPQSDLALVALEQKPAQRRTSASRKFNTASDR